MTHVLMGEFWFMFYCEYLILSTRCQTYMMPLTTSSAWSVAAWLVDLLTQPSCLLMSWSAKSKLTAPIVKTWLMASRESAEMDTPLLDGLPLLSDTQLKVLENSVSMKFSRMSTRKLLEPRMPTDTRKSDGQSLQVQPKSLLTFYCVLGKPLNSKSSYLDLDSNTLAASELLSTS